MASFFIVKDKEHLPYSAGQGACAYEDVRALLDEILTPKIPPIMAIKV
jgi:hypothetical protein